MSKFFAWRNLAARPLAALATALLLAGAPGAVAAGPLTGTADAAPASSLLFVKDQSKGGKPPVKHLSVEGKWRLVAVDRELIPEGARKNATITFDKDGRVSGQAICNTFSGRYMRRDSDIIIQNITGTRKYCEGNAALEDKIFGALNSVDQVVAGENDTIVLSAKGTRRLRYRRY